jgi:hypothetical protein
MKTLSLYADHVKFVNLILGVYIAHLIVSEY